MNRPYCHPRIIEKKTDDQRCNICLRIETLTEDHVPPRSCLRERSLNLFGLAHLMKKDSQPVVQRRSDNGVRYRTICHNCNSVILGKYDKDLKSVVNYTSDFCEGKLVLPRYSPELSIRCRPRAVLQSVLGHLLAAKSITDETCNVDVALRPAILNPATPIPDWIHIFYWLHPHQNVEVMRDIGMPTARGRLGFSSFSMFSILKFYPIGFIVTDSTTYEGLPSFDSFRAVSLEFEAELKLPIDIMFHPTWPRNVTNDGNIVIAVDTFKDATVGLPIDRADRKSRERPTLSHATTAKNSR